MTTQALSLAALHEQIGAANIHPSFARGVARNRQLMLLDEARTAFRESRNAVPSEGPAIEAMAWRTARFAAQMAEELRAKLAHKATPREIATGIAESAFNDVLDVEEYGLFEAALDVEMGAR